MSLNYTSNEKFRKLSSLVRTLLVLSGESYFCFCEITPLANFFFQSRFSFTNIHDLCRTVREGEAISLTPFYQFHPLRRHLDITQLITAENSPLHMAGS